MKRFQFIMMLSLLLMLAGSSTASANDIVFTTNIDGVDITFTGYETDKTCYVGRNVYYDAYGNLSYENHILLKFPTLFESAVVKAISETAASQNVS